LPAPILRCRYFRFTEKNNQTALTSNKVFTTRQLLPATKRDVLPSHHQNNVIYQFLCHCDSRYVGRTSQRLEEKIKQHIAKSITNPPTPHIRQSLPRLGKDTSPRQFHESAIGQRLLNNAQCALHYNKDKFSVLARARTSFYLSALEATFIKSESSSLQTKRIRLLLEDLLNHLNFPLVDRSNVSTRSKLHLQPMTTRFFLSPKPFLIGHCFNQ